MKLIWNCLDYFVLLLGEIIFWKSGVDISNLKNYITGFDFENFNIKHIYRLIINIKYTYLINKINK